MLSFGLRTLLMKPSSKRRDAFILYLASNPKLDLWAIGCNSCIE